MPWNAQAGSSYEKGFVPLPTTFVDTWRAGAEMQIKDCENSNDHVIHVIISATNF